MKVLKRIFQGIEIIIGLIVFYFLFVVFAPGFQVPGQRLRNPKGPPEAAEKEAGFFKKKVTYEVKGISVSAWLYLPEGLTMGRRLISCRVLAS